MKSSVNNRRLLSVSLFLLIDSFLTFYIFITVSAFLIYQWSINIDYNTFKSYYDYDITSVLAFSVLSGSLLTFVLYRLLSHSFWFKPLWDRLGNKKGELEEKHEEVKFRLTENRFINFLARLILGIIILGLPILMLTIMIFYPVHLSISPIILIVMILLFFVLFIIGVCISFNGVLTIAKNTDIRLGLSGRKDFFLSLSPGEWMLSIFLILVGGIMIYFSSIELMPYIISTFELK